MTAAMPCGEVAMLLPEPKWQPRGCYRPTRNPDRFGFFTIMRTRTKGSVRAIPCIFGGPFPGEPSKLTLRTFYGTHMRTSRSLVSNRVGGWVEREENLVMWIKAVSPERVAELFHSYENALGICGKGSESGSRSDAAQPQNGSMTSARDSGLKSEKSPRLFFRAR
jgi:hypothetical protein